MLFHTFIAIALFFLKTEAKTLFVIDIGTVYRLDNKTLATLYTLPIAKILSVKNARVLSSL